VPFTEEYLIALNASSKVSKRQEFVPVGINFALADGNMVKLRNKVQGLVDYSFSLKGGKLG